MKKTGKLSHSEAIERILTIYRNEWVTLPDISLFTARNCDSQCYVVHSRIANLRRQGHMIENRVLQSRGVTMSAYKLVKE